jgi:hypothetical protein
MWVLICAGEDASNSKTDITTDGQSWCQAPSGAQDQILSHSDSCGFVDVWRPL